MRTPTFGRGVVPAGFVLLLVSALLLTPMPAAIASSFAMPSTPARNPLPAAVAPERDLGAELRASYAGRLRPLVQIERSTEREALATDAVVTLPRQGLSPAAWRRLYQRRLQGGQLLAGQASWYAGSRTWMHIPSVALPGWHWFARGSEKPMRVEVCVVGGKCLTVPAVDRCACYAGTPRARLADLNRALVRTLGLSPARGLYQITIRVVR